jgi:hypothetical protein
LRALRPDLEEKPVRSTIRIAACAVVLCITAPVDAGEVVIEAARDATVIEDPDGALANGSGLAFFAGRNNQAENSVRRALIYFDVADVLPDRAVIEAVALELTLVPSNQGPRAIRLYRVLVPWGEGPTSSSGGGGAPSEPGDVTWLHTFYDDTLWVEPGGQFLGRPSAEAIVIDPGPYTWGSTQHMVNDVRLWNESPRMNFGWILLGDETLRQTAKAFASREQSEPDARPRLRITYRLPGEAPTSP